MDCTMVSVCLQRRLSCRSHAWTASYSSISGKRLRASLFRYAWIRKRVFDFLKLKHWLTGAFLILIYLVHEVYMYCFVGGGALVHFKNV